MILSKKNKFIFIKGKKVAGTSVEVLLSGVCGAHDIITPITPIDERCRIAAGFCAAQNYSVVPEAAMRYISTVKGTPIKNLGEIKTPREKYYNHMSLKHVIGSFGSISEDWSVFAIDRCPYRKLISFANMRPHLKYYKSTGSAMECDLVSLKKSLAKLFESGAIDRVKNIDLYKDQDGKMRATVLRYENLAEDLSKYLATLGIGNYPMLKHLKKGLGSNSIELKTVFTKCQIKQVNDCFAEEFEVFGYPVCD